MDHAEAASSVSGLVHHICSRAGICIQAANAAGNALPITALSKKIGEELDTDKTFCYYIITKYMQTRGDLMIKNGPKGGIVPKVNISSEVAL